MSPPRSANQLPELSEKDQARFWSKVALPNEQGCMLWLGRTTRQGYAQFDLNRKARGKTQRAHRISYVLAYGPIPVGLVVDHVKTKGCTNRHCVAPLHLEAVTLLENIRRGPLNARERAKTHCPQGHAYTAANTYLYKGWRSCRTCRRDRDVERRARAGKAA